MQHSIWNDKEEKDLFCERQYNVLIVIQIFCEIV